MGLWILWETFWLWMSGGPAVSTGGGCSRAVYRPLKTWLRRRDAEIGAWLGLHRVTRAAVRASGSLETYSSSGPPCTSDRGTCSMTFVSDGPAATVTVAVSRSPRGVHTPVTAVIAWMSPLAAVHRRASHKSARAGSVAWIAVSAASSASSFSMSSSRSRRSASSDWAMSIRNMGNGPRRMAPPRPVSGAGEGVSWDGVERSDMVAVARKERVACGRNMLGGGADRGVGKRRCTDIIGSPNRMGRAGEKQGVPRAWP